MTSRIIILIYPVLRQLIKDISNFCPNFKSVDLFQGQTDFKFYNDSKLEYYCSHGSIEVLNVQQLVVDLL